MSREYFSVFQIGVAFHFIWHTSFLIIWRTGSEAEVEMGGAGTFSAEDMRIQSLLRASGARQERKCAK
jgi:hypothetical protein